jgi:hypothetical protein
MMKSNANAIVVFVGFCVLVSRSIVLKFITRKIITGVTTVASFWLNMLNAYFFTSSVQSLTLARKAFPEYTIIDLIIA